MTLVFNLLKITNSVFLLLPRLKTATSYLEATLNIFNRFPFTDILARNLPSKVSAKFCTRLSEWATSNCS